MYVTRRLSGFKDSPSSLSLNPQQEQGPNSGYLVIQDKDSETYCCFGLCRVSQIEEPPVPQNKKLTVLRTVQQGESTSVRANEVIFIPALNQPLSSNRYYAIVPHGSHKGEAYLCSREEDKRSFCLCSCVRDVKPAALDHRNPYQQVEIVPRQHCCAGKGYFTSKSVAADGFPTSFLRQKDWRIRASKARNIHLDDAFGIDAPRRARLPDFGFPLARESGEAAAVGKWYCPFMFVRDGEPKEQVKQSPYYEMTLEQRWVKVREFGVGSDQDRVELRCPVKTEVARVAGDEAPAACNEGDGGLFVIFVGRGGGRAGVSCAIMERMRWEEEKAGWVDGAKGAVEVRRVEETKGRTGKVGFYVLVERFCLKRMDGGLVLSYEFWHTEKIQSKWG